MNIKQRFIQIRKQLQLTQSGFAEKLEESPMFVSGVESGKVKSIRPEVLIKLHERFNVNLNWLLSGSGEMFVQ